MRVRLKFFLLILLFFFIQIVFMSAFSFCKDKVEKIESQKIPSGSYHLDQGEITFELNYLDKVILGKSTELKGIGLCNQEECHFFLEVEAKSFDTGHKVRNQDMFKIIRAKEHPKIEIFVDSKSSVENKFLEAEFKINFGGESFTYSAIKSRVEFNSDENSEKSSLSYLMVSGNLPIKLTNHHIERPKIFFIPIQNNCKIHFQGKWSFRSPNK